MTNHAFSRPPPPAVADDWALFLDVDGSLVGFDDDPARTSVSPALVETLRQLSHRLGGALALVSGRRIAALDAMFAPAQLSAAGLHGLEHRHDGPAIEMAAVGSDRVPAIVAEAQAALAAFPGAIVEDKGLAIALHWRGNPSAESAARTFAEGALPRLPGYRPQPGNQVLELRPEGGDKGAAIIRFMAVEPFHGRTPVFVGDDLTDEHGFAAVNALGGISVLVGARADSAACCALADPEAVHHWLGVSA